MMGLVSAVLIVFAAPALTVPPQSCPPSTLEMLEDRDSIFVREDSIDIPNAFVPSDPEAACEIDKAVFKTNLVVRVPNLPVVRDVKSISPDELLVITPLSED